MPTASKELREKMIERFGNIDIFGPQEYLINKGYILNNYEWIISPDIESFADIPEEDWDCIDFLIDEWDYGK